VTRVLFHVNHLWGAGHFARIAAIANACADEGLDATVLSGNTPLAGRLKAGIRLVELPAIRARDETYAALADANGEPPGEALWAARRTLIAAAIRDAAPDVLVIETWPFGRRKLKGEILGLIEAACAANAGLKIAVSVRDLPTPPREPWRLDEAAAHLRDHACLVLAHGDPAIADLGSVWPGPIHAPVEHTGYVADAGEPFAGERRGVIVSAGGGGHGAPLLAAALEARAHLPELRDEPWTLVAGPFARSLPEGAAGVTVLASVPDLPARIAKARVAVARGGYNTVIETIAAGTPLVIAPHVRDGEPEQAQRAEAFAARKLAVALRPGAPEPAALAEAVRAALALPPAARPMLDGALRSARRIAALGESG
jgi:predicted glycosyltransferase